MLAVFWEMFQLTISPFNRIDRMMEDIGKIVGHMLIAETSRNRTVEGQDNQVKEESTIDRLAKKYLWWSPKRSQKRGHQSLQECL